MVLQIVAMYAFNKSKYADDLDCDIDFETMRLVGFNVGLLIFVKSWLVSFP